MAAVVSPESNEVHFGLSKREYFAAIALQGLLGTLSKAGYPDKTSVEAVMFADALIEALNKSA
jgi:hypothetical protein